MSEAPTKFTRRHKLLLASLATVSLSLGAGSIVSAAQNPAPPTRGNAPVSEEIVGVDCVDGLDAKTGAQCDGGPAANATGNERDDHRDGVHNGRGNGGEDNSAASDEVDGVDCENGIVKGTTTECDGGPTANPEDGHDDANEEGSESANE